MNKAIGAAVLAVLPALAHAQTQVPAIQAAAVSSASTSVSMPSDHSAGSTTPLLPGHNEDRISASPATMPPPIPLVSSTVAPLNLKERHAVALSRKLGEPE